LRRRFAVALVQMRAGAHQDDRVLIEETGDPEDGVFLVHEFDGAAATIVDVPERLEVYVPGAEALRQALAREVRISAGGAVADVDEDGVEVFDETRQVVRCRTAVTNGEESIHGAWRVGCW